MGKDDLEVRVEPAFDFNKFFEGSIPCTILVDVTREMNRQLEMRKGKAYREYVRYLKRQSRLAGTMHCLVGYEQI